MVRVTTVALGLAVMLCGAGHAVLRVQPGDTVRLTVRNGGSLPTNVHYHGLNVSPLGAGDNVFIEIDPTTSFQYDMPIPSNHPVGLFWYHPTSIPASTPRSPAASRAA